MRPSLARVNPRVCFSDLFFIYPCVLLFSVHPKGRAVWPHCCSSRTAFDRTKRLVVYSDEQQKQERAQWRVRPDKEEKRGKQQQERKPVCTVVRRTWYVHTYNAVYLEDGRGANTGKKTEKGRGGERTGSSPIEREGKKGLSASSWHSPRPPWHP